MVIPCSLWLLSVCLLSWCCGAQLPVALDPELESGPKHAGIRIHVEVRVTVIFVKTFKEIQKSGIYVPTLEIGKKMIKDVENQVLDACSQLCQNFAQDPKFQHGYIIAVYFKGHHLLCCS
ncbi:palmitoyl-protein thioesterase 1-like [Mus pahari]|uniref:palmitoyl-protein thioesterase 1-like n=1 Tax=Mus pahari TaxID=10093 RepID=UPI000A30FADF|nr:palmitoyl-protein thioesterase 1-like [Mus pahari]